MTNTTFNSSPFRKSDTVDACFISVFVLVLVASVLLSLRGWNNLLTDYYAFRQTQTAISVYYLLKEGFTFNYITPVLGPPWSIPMEFPTYQFVVAAVAGCLPIPLDQAGRLVSQVFFYLCFLPLNGILHILGLNRIQKLIVFCLLLASPLYIFWSRTFMIESTALFFSLMYAYAGMKALKTNRLGTLAVAVLSGVLASLTKITTFGIYGLLLLLVFFFFLFLNRPKRYCLVLFIKNKFMIHSYVWLSLYAVVIFALPVGAGTLWTHHADTLKAMNPLADFIISTNLSAWNFGTLEQKLTPGVWFSIFNKAKIIISAWYVLLLTPLIFLNRRLLPISCFIVLSYLAGPVVFTNLYYHHEYYFYANAILMIMLTGFTIVSLYKVRKLRPVALILLVAIISVMYSTYFPYYTPMYNRAGKNNITQFNHLKNSLDEDDILLIFGNDWNSTIPYYSKRKAIMARADRKLKDPDVEKAINRAGRENVNAMVVCGVETNDQQYINERLDHFGFHPKAYSIGKYFKYFLRY